MARKLAPKKSRSGITVTQAAAKLGISTAAVRKWLKQEKSLTKGVTKKGGVTLFTPAGMKLLGEIKQRRFAAAPPSLKVAWAKRKAGAGKPRKAKRKAGAKKKIARKVGKTPRKKALHPGLEKAWAARRRKAAARRRSKARAEKGMRRGSQKVGVSGDEAAEILGINKVKLYQLLKRYNIKKKRGLRSFTPDVLEQVAAALREGRAVATRAHRAVQTEVRGIARRVSGSDEAAQAMALVKQAVDSTVRVASEFRETLRELFEQQRTLVERAFRPIRIKLDTEE